MGRLRWLTVVGCLCSCVVSAHADATIQNFDGGGTPFTLSNYGGSSATIQPAGNPGNAVQLTYASGTFSQTSIDFDRTNVGPFVMVSGDFDFKVVRGAAGGADGFNFSLLNTANYGTTGSVGLPNGGLEEEPNFTGSLGLEFNTFNNGPPEDVSNNEFGVHFNNVNLASVDLTPFGYNLANGAYNHVHFTVTPVGGGSDLAVTLSGAGNPTIMPVGTLFIAGLNPYEYRVSAGARTGLGAEDVLLDNIDVASVPEIDPGCLAGALTVLTGGVLMLRGRRRRS